MALIDRLKRRRDKIQQQLDPRGFRGGGTIPSEDATAKETVVSEVTDLNRIIAERETRDHDA